MRDRVYWLLALGLTLLFGAAACQAEPKVTIDTKQSGQVSFKVEVADTAAKREMGLQYRRELSDDRGMIFIFRSESQQSFWMKNTPIALDMIFINRGRRIVGIVEQTTPFSLDPRSVALPSQFVLEIRGGLARRYGIEVGDTVRFDEVPANVKE